VSVAIDTSNHRKYTQGAKNPVVRRLLDNLFAEVARELRGLGPSELLDAGCGEGHALVHLGDAVPPRVVGFDLNPDAVAHCAQAFPAGAFTVEDIRALPYADASFDAVLCIEFLEHLDDPAGALAELGRVCRGHLVLTVPFEPWFQLGNLARGQHLAGWGNHPEHVQHWGVASFRRFLERDAGLVDVRVRPSFPWLVATARVRR
jgi:SAM-dependent methyltransferase